MKQLLPVQFGRVEFHVPALLQIAPYPSVSYVSLQATVAIVPGEKPSPPVAT